MAKKKGISKGAKIALGVGGGLLAAYGLLGGGALLGAHAAGRSINRKSIEKANSRARGYWNNQRETAAASQPSGTAYRF